MHISEQPHKTDNHITVMLTSGPDSPAAGWRERLLRIIQRTPPEIDDLNPFIQFVVEALRPSRIYLLPGGSEAAGEKSPTHSGEGSSEDIIRETENGRGQKPLFQDAVTQGGKYYDLLVVAPGLEGISFPEIRPLFELAYLKEKRVHCTLHDQGAVIEGLRNGHIFYSLHCLSENLIYTDQRLAFPEIPASESGRRKRQALNRFKDSMALARDFYRSAVSFQGEENSPLIAFFLNQAVELTYRGVLNALTGACKKTHEIKALQKEAKCCASRINKSLSPGNATDERLIAILDNAYIAARYDKFFSVEPADLAALVEKVGILQNAAENLITERLGRFSTV